MQPAEPEEEEQPIAREEFTEEDIREAAVEAWGHIRQAQHVPSQARKIRRHV